MKKLLYLLIILLIPISVKADLKVSSHYIDAEIEIGGALNVKEIIIAEGTGDFLVRKLNYYSFDGGHWSPGEEVNLDNGNIYNAQSISMMSVSAYKYNDEKIEFGSFDSNVKDYFSVLDLNIKTNKPKEILDKVKKILSDNSLDLVKVKISDEFEEDKYIRILTKYKMKININDVILNISKIEEVKEVVEIIER